MNFIFVLVQIFSGGFIAFVFASLFLRGFSNCYVHPEDTERPFTQQRIRISNLGEDSDFVPRGQVWAGLFLVIVAAIIWLTCYLYFGSFLLQYVKWLAIPFT